MADNNLPGEPGPVDTSPQTYDEQVSDIADFLDETPETDRQPENEAQAADVVEAEAEPQIDVSEDVEQDGAQQPNEPQDDYAGGRFAADDAKVKLADGSVISVSDLKRNNLFQRDYTRKTTEHAEALKAFEAEKSQVNQQAQTLQQLAERITTFAKNYLPQPPEPFAGTVETDPIGYMRHMQQQQAYDQAITAFNAIGAGKSELSEADQRKASEAAAETLRSELATLTEKDSSFADAGKAKAFFDEAVAKGADWWGLTPEEVGAIGSHKAILILKDAMRYRRAVEKAGQVPKQVQQRPVVAAGRRADPTAQVNAQKQQRSDRLRKSGRMQDGVASLMDLDL